MPTIDNRIEIGSTESVLFTIKDEHGLTMLMQDGRRLVLSAEPILQADAPITGASRLVATMFVPGAREGSESILASGPDAEIQASRTALIRKLSAAVRAGGTIRRHRPRRGIGLLSGGTFGFAFVLIAAGLTMAANGYGLSRDGLPSKMVAFLLSPTGEYVTPNAAAAVAHSPQAKTRAAQVRTAEATWRANAGEDAVRDPVPVKPTATVQHLQSPRPPVRLTTTAFSRAGHDRWGIANVPREPEWNADGRIPLPLPGGGTMTKFTDLAAFGLKF